MSLGRFPPPSRHAEEAERPFWISYADLMTALMILFLVIMVTALSSITAKTQEVIEDSKRIEEILNDDVPVQSTVVSINRASEIESICQQLSDKAASVNTNINVDCKLNRINFGEVGRFNKDEYKLSSSGTDALNDLVPVILETANSPLGKKWFKQVLIEGFTDTDGSYLYNLNLSLKRSEWVMCALLRNDMPATVYLTAEQRRDVKKLFLAGGVSFNGIRDSKDESRRVELRLQFYGTDSQRAYSQDYEAKFADDSKERCFI